MKLLLMRAAGLALFFMGFLPIAGITGYYFLIPVQPVALAATIMGSALLVLSTAFRPAREN
ncbi:hypothetical protein [Sinobaca sp. H24]|uniref:hypothetical protein n=1 Tax=Sinobaca sp. H24 TaxID=2923376 RepID=UPI00207A5074|nr:hypothetical protein [Sinobaca sp. H24]